jgi:hypothetical protein
MLQRSLSGALALAGAGALAACGGSAPTPSPSPTVPAGCNTPSGYVFTDGSAHANVTGATPSPNASSSTPLAQAVDVSGVWSEPFESSRPNSRFDPNFRGAPWLNVNLGSATKGVVIEIQGQDPCALSPDGSHSYVAIVYGRDNSSRYGGNCSVTVDAFNSGGFRGRFNCTKLQQFNSARFTIDAQGTFSATGHVYTPTPTAAPTPTATARPTTAPTPTPAPPTPTPTPAVTPTGLVTP